MNNLKKTILSLSMLSMLSISCYDPETDDHHFPQIVENEEEEEKVTDVETSEPGGSEEIHIPISDNGDTVGATVYIDSYNENTEFFTFNELEARGDITVSDSGVMTVSTNFCKMVKEIELPSRPVKPIKSIKATESFTRLEKVILNEGFENLAGVCLDSCKKLKSLYISSTVKNISSTALLHDDELSEIAISKDNPKYDSRENCNAIIETSTNKVIAFSKYSTLVEGLKILGQDSSISDVLDVLSIPASMETITYESVLSCNEIKNIEVASGNQTFYSDNNGNSLVTRAGKLILASQMLSETLPTSVTSIGDYAFSKLKNHTRIIIPSTVTSLDNYALYTRSSGVDEIVFNCYTNDIPDAVFQNMKSGSFVIGEGPTTIGSNRFQKCSSINNITIPNSVMSIGSAAFFNCLLLKKVNFKNTSSLTTLGDSAFESCTKLDSFSCPSNLKSIGDKCFYGDYSLRTFTFNDKLESIGSEAFFQAKFESITLPSSLKTIGTGAFYSCSLTSIVIPASVTSLGEEAFALDISLETATFSSGITSIPTRIFSHCNKLSQVKVPSTVTSVGEQAFLNCPETLVVEFAGTQAQWENAGGKKSGAKKVKMSNGTIVNYS